MSRKEAHIFSYIAGFPNKLFMIFQVCYEVFIYLTIASAKQEVQIFSFVEFSFSQLSLVLDGILLLISEVILITYSWTSFR